MSALGVPGPRPSLLAVQEPVCEEFEQTSAPALREASPSNGRDSSAFAAR
ncbi:hypothetical protein G6045_01260 [Streptomyces sp. YC504]|uniref:Uncharacterized protein n=1 Tax=Streptomyces mesophilus TaxID=1775132 RepID=A0A6G4X9U6_9ACTN|nr:hypothetical protein [Streptomyces mesophilus]NGO74319.1 hypothetical protein [Streptomyces mesophilus]